MGGYYNDNTVVLHNGEFIKAKDAACSLYTQTLHYGHGVFEGIRSYNVGEKAKIFKAKEHFERLIYSANKLHIPFHYTVDELTELSFLVLEKNNLKDAYIRPLVYLEGSMHLSISGESSLFIAAWEWGKYLGSNLTRLMLSSYQRPNPKAFHIEAKATGHYVNSILATTEAKYKGYDEALLLDSNNYIAEASGANFFFEQDGKLITPPLGNILPGITRNVVISLARDNGITVEEKYFTIEDLKVAESAFVTGTAAEITGVASVNDILFPKPYEQSLGAKLYKYFQELTSSEQNYVNK